MVTEGSLVKSGNIVIEGPHNKPIVADFTIKKDGAQKPLIIFSHGFKGFKDWGHFNLMADRFASHDFAFLKFNFSHNGTTPDILDDYADLEAFAQNNFTKELDDLGQVIDWITCHEGLKEEINLDNIFLLGHSRGGSISLLKANEDPRVKKLVTWASPSTFENKFRPEEVEYWKQAGIIYVENARTKQMMPLHYQMVEDYFNNLHRVHVKSAAKKIQVPCLFVQGTQDDVITMEEAHQLHRWVKNSRLLIIEEGDHTFGTVHPYLDADFKGHFKQVFENTMEFLKG
jgi:uncharacterized protein